ncbi:MAG TPA: phosphoenolpyruvate synthase [archaeon]|nr:phosphoenolpyruvate synthase [archaeon]
MQKYIIPFKRIRMSDVPLVGGKTASLGELLSIGMPVPDGFAVTAGAYRFFLKHNNLESRIANEIKKIDRRKVKDINSIEKVGSEIRKMIIDAEIPKEMEKQIIKIYRKMRLGHVAVRSSATAEDLPDASFAGQQESYLNVTESELIKRIKDCFASLFTNRAISYREDKGFDHFKIALSVAVQKQIFSEASGVMFTLEPDSGNKNFIFINGSWGLGDYIVQGVVNPDEFLFLKEKKTIIEKIVAKKHIMEIRSEKGVKRKKVPKNMQCRFVLSDEEIKKLAELGIKIEKHYGKPMDIEWAKAGGKIYIIQARPETVHSQKKNFYEEYRLMEKGRVIAEGNAIGKKISSGKANIIKDAKNIGRFKSGQILVTRMTDPDWEPIMKIAAGIVTEDGGRTSHAAIISRELGMPAVVGVSNATKLLKGDITIDCSQEKGKIYKGKLKCKLIKHEIKKLPKTKTKIYVNIGEPESAMTVSLLPIDGVGLAREEFIITSFINEHPLAMIKSGREKEYIEKLSAGIAKIAACFYPRAVIVRLSDFKSNEYRNLKGGEKFEPEEENPMIGWRGASRYISPEYEAAFRLELKAIKKCIDSGLNNIKIMIPFCRTIEEARKTIKIIKSERIRAEIGVMAEIPSNILLASDFSKYFSFFSIGSNDLTQLTLGIDRDSKKLAKTFDERNPAVKKLIKQLIHSAHLHGRAVGICGQAPSDYPDFAKFLVEQGIDSISINPDVAIQTRINVSKYEKEKWVK